MFMSMHYMDEAAITIYFIIRKAYALRYSVDY